MKISRHYTTPNQYPYAEIDFRLSKSEIRNPDGSMVFSLDEVEVPLDWSQVATDILAQKYFRRAGVPARVSRHRRTRGSAGRGAIRIGTLGRSGLRPSRRRLDLLGLEAPLFRRSR